MMKVRMIGFAVVVAVLSGLIGISTYGQEVRPLTPRELQETAAGTLYYCATKTGGFMPGTGCSNCVNAGVWDVWYETNGQVIVVSQTLWRNCNNNMGDDACYRGPYPMESGSTPTCTKNLVLCGGTATYHYAAGCMTPLAPDVANRSGLSGTSCLTQRLQATDGTATGVNCSGETFGMF